MKKEDMFRTSFGKEASSEGDQSLFDGNGPYDALSKKALKEATKNKKRIKDMKFMEYVLHWPGIEDK